jgi:hypothetical protein
MFFKWCRSAYHIHDERPPSLQRCLTPRRTVTLDKWNKKSPALCEDLSCIMGLTWTPYWDSILSDLNLIPLQEISQYNRSEDLWRTPLIGVFHCTNSLFITPINLFIHEKRYRHLLTYFSNAVTRLKINHILGFHVVFRVFWVMTPYSLVEDVYPEGGSRKLLRNVGTQLPHYTAP